MRNILRAAIAAAAAIAALAFTVPAFAAGPSSGGSATATGTITSTITLSGLGATINLGTLTPGTQTQAPAAESYHVASNDSGGYVLTITPSGSGLTSGSSTIPNNDMMIGEVSEGIAIPLNATGPTTLDTQTGAASISYTENWYTTPPATTPGGTFTENFQYLALGN